MCGNARNRASSIIRFDNQPISRLYVRQRTDYRDLKGGSFPQLIVVADLISLEHRCHLEVHP
jgi:hypothetical protein